MNKILIILILLTSSGICFATAGGGIFYGDYFYDSDFSSSDLKGAGVFGGYGYGSDKDGVRSGGFGIVMDDESDDFYGAFGGVITGQEAKVGPIIVAANLWAGLGGSNMGFSGFGEVNGEVGFPIFSWFQVVAYCGVQYIAPIKGFFDSGMYSPVAGVRFVWGSFK